MSDELTLPVSADTSTFVQEIARATAALVAFAQAEDEARKQAAAEAEANKAAAEARKKATEASRAAEKAAREKAKADKEAAEAAKKAAEEEKKRGDGVDQFNQKLKDIGDSIGKYTFAFNQVTAAISTVAGAVRDGVESVVRLGGEFNRIQASAQATGINFDRAAASTGAYVDKLQLASEAMRFNQAGHEISQRQMEALIARAREYSRVNGDMAGSLDALTDAVLEGEEDGLRRFGGSLASLGGEAHTVQERLQALTNDVQHQTEQVVTAADRWERFKGSITEAGREASGGFMQGLTDAMNQGDLATRRTTERTVELTQAMSESDRAIHANTLRVQAFENSLTRTEVFDAFGHGVEGMHQVVNATGDSILALGHGILALGGTAGSIDDMTDRWRRAGDAIDRARVAVGLLNVEMNSTVAPIEGAPNPAEGPSLSDSLTRFGASLLQQGRDTADLARGRGRLGQAAIQQARAMERKHDAATLAARPQQHHESPKQIGRMVGNILENPHQLLAAQLGFTGESPDSLAVLDEDYGTETAFIEANAGKSAAQRAVNEAAFGQTDDARMRDRRRESQAQREQREQERRLDQRETFLERWERLNQREIIANDVLAESMSMGFNVITTSFSDHLRTLLEGNEAGAQFWEKMAADTMAALGKEAFGKSAFYAAESLGFLVMGNLPQAGTAAAASVAYGVAGAALTYGAAEMGAFAPETKGASGGGSAGGGSPSRPRLSASGSDTGGQNTTTVVNHYYSPVIGGRESSNAEVGTRLGRYEDARDRRVRRDRS